MFVRLESFWMITVTIILPWDPQQQWKKRKDRWGTESLETLGAVNQVADKVQTQHCEAEAPELWLIFPCLRNDNTYLQNCHYARLHIQSDSGD